MRGDREFKLLVCPRCTFRFHCLGQDQLALCIQLAVRSVLVVEHRDRRRGSSGQCTVCSFRYDDLRRVFIFVKCPSGDRRPCGRTLLDGIFVSSGLCEIESPESDLLLSAFTRLHHGDALCFNVLFGGVLSVRRFSFRSVGISRRSRGDGERKFFSALPGPCGSFRIDLLLHQTRSLSIRIQGSAFQMHLGGRNVDCCRRFITLFDYYTRITVRIAPLI